VIDKSYEFGRGWILAEPELEGRFTKWNNNAGALRGIPSRRGSGGGGGGGSGGGGGGGGSGLGLGIGGAIIEEDEDEDEDEEGGRALHK
jgi:hypothetical protein